MSSGEEFVGIVVFTIIGILFTWQGAALLRIELRRAHAPRVKVEGTVIAAAEHHDEGTTYLATVKFTDRNGDERVFVDDIPSSWRKPSIGETRSVFYPPDDPTRAWAAHPITRTIAGLLCLLIGMLLLVAVCYKLAL